jgi:hypothetical protein
MAQKTAWTGAALTEADINTYLMGEGGAWTSHTPQIDQGASTNIAKTVNYSKYARYGRTIVWSFSLSLTASGTAGSPVTVTTPVTAVSGFSLHGSGAVYDTSASAWTTAHIQGSSATAVLFTTDGVASGWGQTPSIALASGDVLIGQVTFEAAT